ncbi:histidine phosphatase family protein [Modestobacter sp. I12A-02628]|uniref:Histidine phosphatase family protein n=1 Tax=Goekera deserti TaxID=2497753 RepID=A0A7K3WBI7_9ACTN|nr:histidine phosphatase family protein [Goekera deserti]MPQ97460.1 histidine phosphatase family protein [Goekera deserti]NDI47939.1 histidine phosphatase family protein [Goekera deserti]NEL53687.1 histidine phosphatase family protein [Goekera deserti]
MSGRPLPDIAVPRLVLWRHGRTAWNAAGRFQGQLDPPLDATGHQQARETAPLLAAAGVGAADSVLVSSDLVRAVQTATALGDLLGLPLRCDERLRENGLGSWEGLTRDEVAERFPDQFADWMAGRPVPGRGGEQPPEVAARALAALADLPPAPVAVVVTHGGTSLRMIEALLELGSQQRRVLGPLGNCRWSELRSRDGRWRLTQHNTGLPPGTATGSVLPDRRSGGDVGVDVGGAPATVDDGTAPAQDADASS